MDWMMNQTNYSALDTDILFGNFERIKNLTKTWEIVIPVTIGIVMFIGLVGNSLVIYVTITTQRVIKHPVHSILVLNLAAADIIYLVVSAPHQVVSNSKVRMEFDQFLCPALYFMKILTMAVGIFTMCALAGMRFMALIAPFRIQGSIMSTRRFGAIILAVVWLIGAVIATPNLVYYRSFVKENTTEVYDGVCSWQDPVAEDRYAIALFVVTYLIPFLLVANFYFFIGREVCYLVNRPLRVDIVGGRSEQREYKKTTIMVLCLILAFLFCWFPHHLYAMMKVSGNYSGLGGNVEKWITMATIETVGICMSYMHSCINPVIYTFAAPGFRRSLCESITGRTCKDDNERTDSCRTRRKWRRHSYSNCAPQRTSHDAMQMLAIAQQEPPTCLSRLPSPLLSAVTFGNSNDPSDKLTSQDTKEWPVETCVRLETPNGHHTDVV